MVTDDRPASEVLTGWQNVAREIRRRILGYRCRDGERLIERETAELEAWRTAHAAVLDRIEAMADGDDDESNRDG